MRGADPGDELQLRTARALASQLHASRRGFRLWNKGHGARDEIIRNLVQAIAAAAVAAGTEPGVRARAAVVLGVREGGFWLHGRQLDIGTPDLHTQPTVRRLAAAGARAVRFRIDVSATDVNDFCEWLATDPTAGGDDAEPWNAEGPIRLLAVDPGGEAQAASPQAARLTRGQFLPLGLLPEPDRALDESIRSASERSVTDSPTIRAALGILQVLDEHPDENDTEQLQGSLGQLISIALDRFDIAGVSWILDEASRRLIDQRPALLDDCRAVLLSRATDIAWWDTGLRFLSDSTVRALPAFLMRLGTDCIRFPLASGAFRDDPRLAGALVTIAQFQPEPFLDLLEDRRSAVALSALEVILRSGIVPPIERRRAMLAQTTDTVRTLGRRISDPAFLNEPSILRQGLLTLLANGESREALAVLDSALSVPMHTTATQHEQLLHEIAQALAQSNDPAAQDILTRHAGGVDAPARSACQHAMHPRPGDTKRESRQS